MTRTRALRRAVHGRTRMWFTFTRQGALAAVRRVGSSRVVAPTTRVFLLLAGSILVGVGVASFAAADLGFAPYDVLLNGIDQQTALSHGQAAWAVSATLIASAAILGVRPQLATVAYVLATGLAVDSASAIIEPAADWPTRVVLIALGLGSLATGISLVGYSNSTGGAFELLMRAGERRGRSATMVRTLLEISAFGLGVALGGDFGPATVLVAISIGPLLRYVTQALADHHDGRSRRRAEVPTA